MPEGRFVASRFVTLGVLLTCIVLLGITFYQVIAPFFLPLFLAAVLAILCQPLYQRTLAKTGYRTGLAAGITTALVVLILVAPVVLGTVLGTIELGRLAQDNFQNWDWSQGIEQLGARFLKPAFEKAAGWLPGILDPQQIEQMEQGFPQGGTDLAKSIAEKTFFWASSTVGAVLSLLISGGMFLVAIYYFLADGPALIVAAETLIPLPVEHQRQLRGQFCKVVRAVVMATFLAAFAQGLATAAALQVVGVGHFFVFLVLATMAALIPLAGTWIVWGPCAAWLAFEGHYGAAIGLALFGIIVVGLLDNVIRTYVLNSDAQLHPLLAFVSVLGALQVMGLWGIFFGPIIASCLYALVQIFNSELQQIAVASPQQTPIPASTAAVELAPANAEPARAAAAENSLKPSVRAPTADANPQRKKRRR